uniref:OCEL domain-containing protein n=2 Tax=Plectus sambesii TaxID=2011161 RepID=A0A914WTG4_9BILA
MKKSLRQRVVHAVVLGKYSRDGVLERLRKDGLNDGDDQRVGPIIEEVSEAGKDGRLSLKSSLYSEVDANKWQWFTTDEKVNVKRILSGSTTSSSSSANFAPSRKSAMAPPQAPAPASAVPAATAPPSSASLDVAPSKSSPPSKSPANGNPLDELLPPPVKRRREQQPTNGPAEKRPPPPPLPRSQSPPEDPKDSPPSMNGSIGRPTPSVNWDSYYPDIQSDADAERYYCLFHKDYPLYMTCYKTLADVAKEFSDLERQLSEAPKNTKEHNKVERSIQTKFSHYQKDSDFQRMRQQHGDLRAKLAVLKKRIGDWERQSQSQPPHPTDSPRLQHVDDLMVM